MSSEKITSAHLERAAYVYVRQSSMHQVRHHHESRRRQYGLAEHARELGFRDVVVVDEDLGRSGSGADERPGFGRLVAAVCDGRVGAVLALEASRLSLPWRPPESRDRLVHQFWRIADRPSSSGEGSGDVTARGS
jgi:DNA invertase Pin-like site-specific DNA recombinase